MKRVLVTASTFPRWEGDTVPPFVYQLSDRLSDFGYEMHVLAPHHAGAATSETMGSLQIHRFRYAPGSLENLAYGGGILENLRKKPARWALVPSFLTSQYISTWNLTKRYSFDLIHAHWVIPQGITSAALPAWIRTPKLLTAHGGDVFASKGGLRKGIVRFVTDRHDVITVNSMAMQHAVHELTGHSSTIIPMGVDTARFSGVQHARRSEYGPAHNILVVGRLAEKKGVEYLIRAMPLIRAMVPGAKLTIVGDGPRKSMLENEVKTAGMEAAVTFEGARPNSELPRYYANANLFVAPSVVADDGDTEALGVVLLEASGCGLPVISTRVGGIPDVIKHDETGVLVEQKSPDEIAKAAISLLLDRGRAQALGSAARKHIVENFGWDSVARRFASLYEQLTEPRPATFQSSEHDAA